MLRTTSNYKKAGLFSAVCSTFVIEVQGNLQPDPAVISTAYLEAILKTLQNPGSTGSSPVLPAWTGPPSTDVTVSLLLYASLFTSLFAAFLAMLGKQWLNRYAGHRGGSVAERCRDRQRKLNGLQRWPFRIVIESLPVFLQFSLFLLGAALSRFLWDITRTIASVAIGFTACGVSFYVCIVVAGTLSYECPFQTPLSLILRSLRIDVLASKLISISFPGPGRFNIEADCTFWILDRITDPGIIIVALRQLTNLSWHYNPSEKVPFRQVSKFYMKSFSVGHHLIPEYRNIAHTAGRALIHLYVHRMCSGRGLDHNHQVVINALDHLSGRQRDASLQSLSLIAKSIRDPDWSPRNQWDMANFDLPWVSELWMYHMWFRRTQLDESRVGGIVTERGVLGAAAKLFEKEKSPPHSAIRSVLYGLLAGVSKTPLSLDDLVSLQR